MGLKLSLAAAVISIHALRVEGDIERHYMSIYLKISIHALRVEGDRGVRDKRDSVCISIHALRVEGDISVCLFATYPKDFYPRPPGGGRRRSSTRTRPRCNFYPRPPGGGRPLFAFGISTSLRFLSTPSGWRATAKTDKVFICFCAKGRRICLFKTRKERICRWRFKKDKFWVLIWCEGSGKSVCALASHCG